MIYSKMLLIACILAIPCAMFAHSGQSYFASPVAGDEIRSGASVTLKWTPEEGRVGSIRLSFWDQQTGEWTEIGSADCKVGSYSWIAPEKYGEHLRLRGIYDDGSVVFTNGFFSIKPPILTSKVHSSETYNQLNIAAYPNPFRDFFTVNLSADNLSSIGYEVLNQLGVKVLSGVNDFESMGKKEFRINGAILPAGVYIIRLFTPNGLENTSYSFIKVSKTE